MTAEEFYEDWIKTQPLDSTIWDNNMEFAEAYAKQVNEELRAIKQAAIYAKARLSSPSMGGDNIIKAKEILEQALKQK